MEIRRVIYVLSMCIFILAFQGVVLGESLSGETIMVKVDEVSNAAHDQSMTMKLILIDKSGTEKTFEALMYQRGSDKRLVKFLSPAEQKGIGFLSLPDNIMYVYLPAFGKVRRIASHVTNSKFAGTDFTYEDLGAGNYSKKWIAKLVETTDNNYVLELRPREETKSDYSKLILWVQKDGFHIVKIEHFDKGENLVKIMTRERIEKVDGYWTSKETLMHDLKTGHKTKMILEDIKFDSGLSDDLFTERYLMR